MLAAMAAGLLIPALAQAQALPSGGQVVAGQAGIAGAGPSLTITQTSDKAVIDWSGFSIGQGNAVQFNNGSGATLNRVMGGNLSSIDGLLSATGSVYLINPNGVIVGKSGVVKVGGGFYASTLDIGNANFLNGGDLTFAGPSLASVVNLGQIGALGGDVALVAANVRNDGTVAAPNGALGLLAGNRILMRDSAVDDGRFLVLSGGAGTSATNTGAVEAATAELRAQGGNVYAMAGNTQGLIRATGVSSHDGRIFLSAGEGGAVKVSGSTLAATSNGNGGTIALTGQQITVASDVTLDASGKDVGGTVTAIADMNSGQLDFHGTALAKGALSGGFIETSGHKVDFIGGLFDTTGAKSGTWLVDPDDLTVDASAAATIQTNLATGNVTLQTTSTTASGPGNSTSGSGDITINSDISWSSANTLTLDSYHSIQVNANLTASGAGGVVLTTNHGGSGGDYAFALGKSLSFTGTAGGGQSLKINGVTYTLLYDMAGLSGISASAGYYALAKSLDVSGTTYTSVPVSTFSGTFTGLGNTISNLTITTSGTTTGLFGTSTGTLRNIGLAGGTISSNSTLGSLVGTNDGTIAYAWSSASVKATSNAPDTGGLAGRSSGTIRNSFTTGAVTAPSTSYVGGLVGAFTAATAYISDSYSTSAITAPNSMVSGLVGNAGNFRTAQPTITNSFAAGPLSSSYLNGLTYGRVAVTNGYFDSQVSGTTSNGSGGTAKTTTQLQGALPTGFSSSTWGTDTGLYPYLKSFYPNGAQAISGIVDATGASPVITAYAGGQAIGSTKSVGANKYYYILVPGTGLTATTPIGVSYTYGSKNTLSFTDAPTLTGSNVSGMNLYAQYAEIATSKPLFSQTLADLDTTFGASTISSLMSGLNLATNGWINYDASGDYTVDTPVSLIRYTNFNSKGSLLSINADVTVPASTNVWFFSNKSIAFNANVSATGTSAVTIVTNHSGPNGADYTGGSSGDYSFLPGKSLTFSGTGGFLNINGNVHTLLNSLSDLQGINGQSGYYALNTSLDLTGTSFSASLVDSFSGKFTGLGHTINNLTINAPSTNTVGLFGTNNGTVRDIGLTGGSIYGAWYTGALVGVNNGLVDNAYSSADMHVVYRSGGLVGRNSGTVVRSHATGAVTSNGDNGGVSDMGGLVGWNDTAGLVEQSYATGTVTGTANTTGGLVAFNGGGTITDSFATGGVFGNLYAGGLVGFSTGGSISNSYATGYVHAATSGGGFAGYASGTAITNSYWDTTTSGSSIGVAVTASSGTPTGLTRSVLQNGNLPTGFSSAIWATGSGLYPYLKALFPTGMQSISGTTRDATGAALPAANLALYIDGAQVRTTAASGADGYYYLMAQPGTITSGTPVGITETDHGGTTLTGFAYSDAPTLTGGQVTGLDVRSGRMSYTTAATSFTALQTAAGVPFGSSNYTSFVNALTFSAGTDITASNAFSIPGSASFGTSLSATAAGGLTLNGSVNTNGAVNFGSAVTLAANSTVYGSSVTFGSTVNGGYTLAVSGTTTFSGAVGGTSPLVSLMALSGGTTTLSGNVTTTGYQVYGSNVTLGADVSLSAGGSLGLSGTVNGAHALTLKGTGLSLKGMGGTTPLTSLTGKTTGGGIFVTGVINTTGSILLAANGAFNNTAGASALNAGTNFTVYTQNAGNPTGVMPGNVFGGLTAGNYYNDAYNFTSGTFASAVPTGNHFVYAYAAKLTVTPVTKTLDYNGSIQSTTYNLTGYRTGDASSDVLTGSVTGLAATSKNAGAYAITTSGTLASAQNYQIQYGTGTLTIGKAALTIAAGTDSKTYDTTTTSTGTVSVTGLLGSDTVTGKTQAFDSKNAGSRTLSVIGYTLNDGNSGGNYTVTTQTASGSIAKADLTIAAGTDSKTYDAGTTSTGTVTVTGLLGSDTVTGKTQAFDSKNAGTRTLSVTGYTVNDDNSGGNYTVTTQTASGSIAKADLTIAAGTDSKTYDAGTTSTGTVTVTGLLGSDTVTGKTQAFDSKNAGTRTLSVTGYTVNDDNSGGNYTVTTQTASGSIAKATLTIAAGTDSKTYDAGTTSIGTVTVTGLLGSDTVTGKTQAFDSKNAGTRTLSVTGYTLNDGNSGGNYTVTTQAASGTIDKAALTIAAGSDNKTYDAGTTSTGTVTVTGLLGSDTVTGKSQAFDSKNAGSRTLSVTGYTLNDGNSGGNYTVTTQSASGSIAKAALTIAAGTDSKTYDATTTSTGTVSVTGLQGSDTVTGKSQVFDSKNAGSRTLLVNSYTLNDGNSGDNYTVTTQTASGGIAKAALTIAAGTDSKTYDAATASIGTVMVTGLLGSDTVTGKSQAFDSKNAGSRILSVTGYTLNDGNSGGNYTVTTQTASGSIAKAALTAGLTGSTTKTYDATLSATLTAGNYSLTGITGGDMVALNTPALASYVDVNAGAGKTVTVSGLALLGADAGNYTVNGTASANIGSITPRALTVTADTLGKFAGAADPALTYAITGGNLVGTDTLTGNLARAAGENPGTYDIKQGSLTASSNYDVTFAKGAFTIVAVALQNDPVVNPVTASANSASQPTVKPAPIGLSSGPADAGGSGSEASGSSASDNTSSSSASDAGSAASEGNEKATGPNIQAAGQSSTTCESGAACGNTPYPDNQSISSSITFTSK